ncbi:MAG TPA: Flp family type IVb pilin [Acidimicrobiales bacterium]|nr:Flp family type IVb pilin [Acidimicrobiales bacterium]
MLDAVRHLRRRLRHDERGAGLVEYCLLVALIALVCIGALAFYGSSNSGGLNRSSSCIRAAHDGEPLPDSC